MPTKKASKKSANKKAEPKFVAKGSKGDKKKSPSSPYNSMYAPEFMQKVKLLNNINEVLRKESSPFRISAYASVAVELDRAKKALTKMRNDIRVQREVINMLKANVEGQNDVNESNAS